MGSSPFLKNNIFEKVTVSVPIDVFHCVKFKENPYTRS